MFLLQLAKPEIARLMVVAKDGSDLFENGVIEEVKRLDNIVRAISVEEDGLAFSYTDICAQSDDDCVPEPILMLLHDHNIHPRQLQYPVQVGRIYVVFPSVPRHSICCSVVMVIRHLVFTQPDVARCLSFTPRDAWVLLRVMSSLTVIDKSFLQLMCINQNVFC